ncbi:J domain-containing protein [Aeromonas caviae]
MPLSKTRSTKSARKTPTRPRSSGNPALDLFHRKWQAIEKQQAKIDKFARDGRALYDRITHEIEPLERQQCALIYQLCQRLVTFSARKSFTEWQREVLHDWIHELFRYLESNPFRGELDLSAIAITLQTNSALHMDEETLDEQCDFIHTMLMELCGHAPNDRETLLAFVQDPVKLRDYVEQAHARMAEDRQNGPVEDERFDDDRFTGGHTTAEDDPFGPPPFDEPLAGHDSKEEARIEALFNKSSLKQLYRKLAMALHPDREPDPAQRELKNQLMGQLSHAWEHKEMFTLLQLAHTHLPESESLLSADNLAYINPLLTRRLRELERQYYVDAQEGVMAMVLRRFKQRSKQKTDAAFVEHRDYLEQDIAALQLQLAEITTLKSLKPFLAARLEQIEEAMWHDDDLDLDQLFR